MSSSSLSIDPITLDWTIVKLIAILTELISKLNQMAKLHFYYSAMNAGKSTTLLQSSYNYKERGMDTLIFTPKLDNRSQTNIVASRIGLEAKAFPFTDQSDLQQITEQSIEKNPHIKCILVDEAQFLSKTQVKQLCHIADFCNLPVLTYGLRTDFQGETFPGSQQLLGLADTLIEIKTICHCGRKATMNMRINESGQAVDEGNQVEIGGNDRYVAVCRKHFTLKQPSHDQPIELTPIKIRVTKN